MNTMDAFLFASMNENNGRLPYSRTSLAYGAAGIALVELAELGKIRLDGKRVSAADTTSAGDAMLDEILGIIIKKSPYRMHTMISNIQLKVPGFFKRLMERLEDNGMVRIEQGRFLGLIPYNRYIVSQVSKHTRLVRELKTIVRKGDRRPEAEMALLISMLHTCKVLPRLFGKDERRQVQTVLKAIGRGEFFETLGDMGGKVQKVVKAVIASANAAVT